jgi:hypothetical protein
MTAYLTEAQERNLENFRFSDTKTKKSINRLICCGDENIYDALRRRVQHWEEPGFILVQSLEMPVGSGKSNASLYSACQLDPDFSMDSIENLCFTAKEFLEAVKGIRKGKAVVWDEGALQGGDSHSWHDQLNQTINQAMRLARFKQGYVLIVLPLTTMIDRRIRLLCNIQLEMLGVHHSKKLSYGIFRTLSLKIDKYGRYTVMERLPICFHTMTSFTYISECSFPKLKPKPWSQYLKRKNEALSTLDTQISGDNILQENRRLKLQLRSTKGHLTRKTQQQNERK